VTSSQKHDAIVVVQSTHTLRFVSHMIGPPVPAQSALLEQLAVH
jgi:hypothetical protein